MRIDDDGNIEVSSVFIRLYDAYKTGKYSIYVLEGGSRSTKTISIIQFLLAYAEANIGTPKRIIISRAVGTWITGTVLNDFLNVVKDYGWYNNRNYNKTLKIYKQFDTEFWFVGLDDAQKLHGMSSDGFWVNEAMESDKDDIDQLEMRCTGFGILDYNPTEEEHWIYDNVLTRSNVFFIHSTMLDNPFIPENSRLKILSYEPTEENYRSGTADKRKWEIYGLGKRAKIEGLVFENIEIVKEIPEYVTKRFTGIDFGYTHDPTAIGEVGIWGNELYIDELCYRTRMTIAEIIGTLKSVNNGRKIISESADPRLVDEIYNAGFNIHPVEKGKGSVEAGIEKMKAMKIHVTERSINAIKEFKNYTYQQDKNGKWLNLPIDDFNHIIDLVRYVVLMQVLGKILRLKSEGKTGLRGFH
jgi:phage terminase large subunit